MIYQDRFMGEKQKRVLEDHPALGTIKKLNIFLDLFDLKIQLQNCYKGALVNMSGKEKKQGEVKFLGMQKMQVKFSCSEGVVTSEWDLENSSQECFLPFKVDRGDNNYIIGELYYTELPFSSHPYQLYGFKVEEYQKSQMVRNFHVHTGGRYLSYHNFKKPEQVYFGLLPTRGTSFFSLREKFGRDQYIQICSDSFNQQIKECIVRNGDMDIPNLGIVKRISLKDPIFKQLEYVIRTVYPDFYRNIASEINAYTKGEDYFVKNAIETVANHTMSEEMRKCFFGENFIKVKKM